MTPAAEDLRAARALIERLAREHGDLLRRYQPVVALNLPRGHVLTAAEKFLWRTERPDPTPSPLDSFAKDVAAAIEALTPRLSSLELAALDARLSGEAGEPHATERALRKVRLLQLGAAA